MCCTILFSPSRDTLSYNTNSAHPEFSNDMHMGGTCNYLGCHLPHFPHPCPEHLSLHYSKDGQFHPLSSQYLKVLASVGNTAVGATAAYTDGNAVPAAAGSTPLAVKYTFYSIKNNKMKWLKKQFACKRGMNYNKNCNILYLWVQKVAGYCNFTNIKTCKT